ncbi:hypothetical protein FQR65_LT00234 [Abscondita terminalis]|nr:hypothetical protein FQR65_LT00234 [Abscondita terminalis]
MDVIEREMNRIVPWALLEDFYQLVDLLRDFSLSTSSWPTLSGPCPSLNEIVDEKKEMEIKNNKISVKATIVDPLCDLSHQYVEFPDTPCGSYSIMRIDLRAHTCIANSKCLCYYKKKYGKCKDPLSYRARFEIGSNDAQFSVEPNGGTLHAGQIKKLHVIVRPELPDEKIKEAAQELALRKLEKKSIAKTASSTAAISTEATKMGGASKKVRRERSITKTSETTKATETKTKKKIESTKAKRNQIGFADSEVVVSPGDLYRTEKELLKHMEPYVAKARFCCTVSYASEDL